MTSMGMALGGENHTWSYSNLYAEAPSLANVAGNYADGSDTLTVSSNGVIFEQDPTTGCVINGQASIVNPSYNAYSFSFTFGSCTGNYAALNGQTATGLGYYDDSVNSASVGLWRAYDCKRSDHRCGRGVGQNVIAKERLSGFSNQL